MVSIRQERTEKLIKELKKLFPKTKIALSYSTPWELLVAVVLSAQTTDKKVNEVTPNLFSKYQTPKDYAGIKQEVLERYIKSIGLYRAKAKNITSAARIVNEKYNGRIPDSISELVGLPGVGRKTANVLLFNLYSKSEGIAVDTHVRRLANLFGLTNSRSPEQIEKDLMKIVPKEDWGKITYLLIDYGRKYCPAFCKHTNCPLRSYIEKSK